MLTVPNWTVEDEGDSRGIAQTAKSGLPSRRFDEQPRGWTATRLAMASAREDSDRSGSVRRDCRGPLEATQSKSGRNNAPLPKQFFSKYSTHFPNTFYEM